MPEWTYRTAEDADIPARQRLRSVRREPGLISTVANQTFTLLSGTYLKLLHQLRISGRQYLPDEGPFILAANHCSHLDALCLAAALPARLRHDAFPVAAGDTFFDTPTHTAVAAIFLNALPMWRQKAGRHALDDLREKLTRGRCILLLFPEGTRSRDGVLRPFKAGLGMLAAETSVPVVPCRLRGTFAALAPGARRPTRAPITLTLGPALHFDEVSNDKSGWQQIAQQTQRAVEAL